MGLAEKVTFALNPVELVRSRQRRLTGLQVARAVITACAEKAPRGKDAGVFRKLNEGW